MVIKHLPQTLLIGGEKYELWIWFRIRRYGYGGGMGGIGSNFALRSIRRYIYI